MPRTQTNPSAAKAPKKRGNKGDFHGSRLEFLNARVETYVNSGKGPDFWATLMAAYWDRFPWTVPINEEPAQPILDEDISTLSPEEILQRAKIMHATEEKIKRWFRYRKYSENRTHKNIWSDILLKFNNQAVGHCPKILPSWQVYFRRHKDAINAEAIRAFPDSTSRQNFKERNRLARELFDKASVEEKEACLNEAKRLHAEDLEAWELAKVQPTPTDQTQSVAREHVSEVLIPLVELIGEQTGTCISILIGRPAEVIDGARRKHFLRSVHYGTAGVGDQLWSQFDPSGFRTATTKFMEFVSKSSVHTNAQLSRPDGPSEPVVGENNADDEVTADTTPRDDTRHVASPRLPNEDVPPTAPSPSSSPHVEPVDNDPSPGASPIPPASPVPATSPQPPASPPLSETQPPPKPTLDSLNIGDALRQELLDLPPDELEAEVAMLARLLPLDLERESNKARNRLLMREAGLSEDEIHMWSLPVTTASSKGKGKARQSRSKEDTEGSDVNEEEARDENDVDNELQRPHENEESGEDKSDDDENGVKDAGPPAKTLRERGVIKKPVTRRSGRKTRISSPPPIDFPSLISIPKPPKVNKTGWPQWIIASHQFLTTPDLGGDFASAVSWWVAVERAYGFQTSSRALPTASRPAQVGYWLSHLRREFHKSPDISDITAYEKGWWLWWKTMQPDWRANDVDMFIRQPVGDWGPLVRPGQNGMLMILISLRWWANALSDPKNHVSWARAANDVGWVLSQLTSNSMGTKHVQDNPSPSKRPTKRRK